MNGRFGSRLFNASHLLPVFGLVLLLAGCKHAPKDTQYLASGKQFLKNRDYSRAAIQFRNAIQANPRNAEAQYQLALAEIAIGDAKAAYKALTNALVLNPQHMEAQLKMAELLVTGGPDDLKEAQGHAQAVLDASPDNPDALDAMAVAELKLGNREKAVELLEQASSKAPAHLQTAIGLAMERLTKKDKTGAELVMKQAVEKAPDSLEARAALGAFYILMAKYPEGEQQLRQVLQKNPNHSLALLNLANMLDSLGRKSEAAEMYRRLAAGPEYKSSYGTYLFQIGKKEEAVREFERLIKEDPRDLNLRSRLVAAYIASNRTPDAERVLDAALKKNPKDTDALLQKSELNLAAGVYQDARKDLLQVLRYSSDSAMAHFLLAGVARAEGALLLQRQELAETLHLNSRFFAARILLAQMYIGAGQGASALALMNDTPPDQQTSLGFIEYRNWALLAAGDLKNLQANIEAGLAKQRSRDLLMQSALLKLRQGNATAAQSLALEVLKTNPEDLGAVEVLMRSYAAQKQLPAAIEKVRELIVLRPNSAPLQYRLGVLLVAAGDAKAGRNAFSTALASARPEYAPARLALANLDRAEGKPDAARQELEPLLSSKKAEAGARMQLGMIEAKAGNYDKAIDHFRKLVEANPHNAIALNNLAYLLADHTSRTDEALKYALLAKELAPDDVTVEGTLGWVFFRKGMYEVALHHLQEAVNREGKAVNDGTAIRQYHLSMAYARSGNPERASTTLKAALKLNPRLPEAQAATAMVQDASR